MSSGTKIVHDAWCALRLELPVKRRPQLARFFVGLRPLHPIAYGSLLRAIARALIESGGVRVGRDAPQDPVELIAAALEVSIEQWERGFDEFWNEVAIRIAAFEFLYRVHVRDESVVGLAYALESSTAGGSVNKVMPALEQARHDLAAISSTSEDADAMLAEIVIVGRCSREVAALDANHSKALPLARAALLVRAGRFSEALEVCEEILDRVPGHTLALHQAARCCIERGTYSDAQGYARRASARAQPRRAR